MSRYFNHQRHLAESTWERQRFVRLWRKLNMADRRWPPPYHPILRAISRPQHASYLANLDTTPLHIEALPARSRAGADDDNLGYGSVSSSAFEETVAAAIIQLDPRRQDRAAYLSMFGLANDQDTLDYFLLGATEHLWTRGCRRIVGPTGLSPHLMSGVLQNHFDQTPPYHTAYHPPYVPELFASTFNVLARTQLINLPVPAQIETTASVAQITPLDPARLARSLLPLFQAACAQHTWCPVPDRQEVEFILGRLRPGRLLGYVARIDHNPVGFVLLQPDLSAALTRAKGGKNILRRLWLDSISKRSTKKGRLLWGAVLPEWRGRGIGKQLLSHVLTVAQKQGWSEVNIGPLAEGSSGTNFLQKHGAEPRQEYLIYELEL